MPAAKAAFSTPPSIFAHASGPAATAGQACRPIRLRTFPIENAELKAPALAMAPLPSPAARPKSELVHPEPMLIPETTGGRRSRRGQAEAGRGQARRDQRAEEGGLDARMGGPSVRGEVR